MLLMILPSLRAVPTVKEAEPLNEEIHKFRESFEEFGAKMKTDQKMFVDFQKMLEEQPMTGRVHDLVIKLDGFERSLLEMESVFIRHSLFPAEAEHKTKEMLSKQTFHASADDHVKLTVKEKLSSKVISFLERNFEETFDQTCQKEVLISRLRSRHADSRNLIPLEKFLSCFIR